MVIYFVIRAKSSGRYNSSTADKYFSFIVLFNVGFFLGEGY